MLAALLYIGGLITCLVIAFSPPARWRNPLHWCATAYFMAMTGTVYLVIDEISRQ